jgi:hypothetical protein
VINALGNLGCLIDLLWLAGLSRPADEENMAIMLSFYRWHWAFGTVITLMLPKVTAEAEMNRLAGRRLKGQINWHDAFIRLSAINRYGVAAMEAVTQNRSLAFTDSDTGTSAGIFVAPA